MEMHAWPLQAAKSRFSEWVDRVLRDGPQWVTRRGLDAVVVVVPDLRKMTGQNSLLSTLINAPRGEPLDTVRSAERIRLVERNRKLLRADVHASGGGRQAHAGI